MKRKHMLSIVSLLALAVICVYVSAANAFPAPQGIPLPQGIPDLPSILMDNINNPNKDVPSFEELKKDFIEKVSAKQEPNLYLIEKYVQQNPNDPNGLIMLGRAHLIIGSLWGYDRIAQCFLQASQMGAEEGTILYYYTTLLNYNVPQREAFNGLFSIAQKGNPLAAFFIAECLHHGENSSPLIGTIEQQERENAAAAFYDMVINANLTDWGKDCAEIAKMRMQQMGRTFNVGPNTNSSFANQPSNNTTTIGQTTSSGSGIHGIDDKYLTESQKQHVTEAFDRLDKDAIELEYLHVDYYPPETSLEGSLKANPALYDRYMECQGKLQYLQDTLSSYFNGIYEGKAKNTSYFTNLYNKLVQEKVFDWIEDANKRKIAYDKLKGCCAYYAKAAAAYYQFANISNSHMQEVVKSAKIYENGRTIGEAINFALDKPNWEYRQSKIYCDAQTQEPIWLSREIHVDGYYESALNTMVQGEVSFIVGKHAGDSNLNVTCYHKGEWFDYALR